MVDLPILPLVDITPTDRDFLLKSITSNSAVLFLGAGFSTGATNKLGNTIPLGNEFANILWDFLGYPGDYDRTALPTIFQAALKKKHADVQKLLDVNFRCSSIPDWYNLIPQIFWHKIYTTNVDDLIEGIYNKSIASQKLQVVDGIKDDYCDRDQFLEKIQYIKLNGTLTDTPTSITFSVTQFGERLASPEIWYDHFVLDYSTRPTVFIGTQLDEPLFWQAIASRGKRYPGGRLEKSFLVSPYISPAKKDMLKDFSIVPLESSAKDFFDFIAKNANPLPSLRDVTLKTNPGLDVLLKALGTSISFSRQKNIQQFYSCFRPVRRLPQNPGYRSYFLFGCDPQWEDIFNDYDAPREFTSEIINAVQESLKSNEVSVIAITGSAGSGKSTILKRVAVQLSSTGNLVFFTNSEELPSLHDFENALDLLPGKSVIIFDNVVSVTGILPDYLNAAKRATLKHTFIIAGRANKLIERLPPIKSVIGVKEYPIPDLSLKDIDSIIDVLDRTHTLGQLANTARNQQREIFRGFAHNQILVAMRRATLGHGFDDIIKNEFLTTEPLEAKMLYLCASIATSAEFTISKQQLIGCTGCPPAETLYLIQENLRGILISSPSNPEHYTARHRVIAELIVEQFAPRGMLKEAYIDLLKAISHDLPIGGNTNSAAFRFYRRLINHTTIYNRFSHHLLEARSIYSSITRFFSRDHHFWLQFGSLELEYGELDSAANYIEQAHKYAPTDALILTTRAQLRYKQSLNATLIESAREIREEAREILRGQMSSRPQDNYPYHIYCAQELAWINHWLMINKEKKEALEELRYFAGQAFQAHANSIKLKELVKQIDNAYLDLAKPNSIPGKSFNPVIE